MNRVHFLSFRRFYIVLPLTLLILPVVFMGGMNECKNTRKNAKRRGTTARSGLRWTTTHSALLRCKKLWKLANLCDGKLVKENLW
jgi:hypothetical protein